MTDKPMTRETIAVHDIIDTIQNRSLNPDISREQFAILERTILELRDTLPAEHRYRYPD